MFSLFLNKGKSNLPTSVKVGGLIYKIEFVPANQLNNDLGETDFNKGLIRINKEIVREQQEASLYHEIIHCVNTQLTEEQVDYLSLSLYQIYKDNFSKS